MRKIKMLALAMGLAFTALQASNGDAATPLASRTAGPSTSSAR